MGLDLVQERLELGFASSKQLLLLLDLLAQLPHSIDVLLLEVQLLFLGLIREKSFHLLGNLSILAGCLAQ